MLITKDKKCGASKTVQTNLVKLTLISLVTSSLLPGVQAPLLCQLFHKFLVTLSKGTIVSCSGHFFEFLFSWEDSRERVNI